MTTEKFNEVLQKFMQSLHDIFPTDSNIESTKIILNEYTGEGLCKAFKEELTDDVHAQLKAHNENLIQDSKLMRRLMEFSMFDLNTTWSNLTPPNKVVVWAWFNMLADIALTQN